MATASRVARIERILTRHVDEGLNPPYQTSARALFSHVVEEALGKRDPTWDAVEPFVEPARAFVSRHWGMRPTGSTTGRGIPLPTGGLLEWARDRSVFIYKGYFQSGGRQYHASISQDSAVVGNRVTPAQLEAANARLPDLKRRAEERLRQMMGEKPGLSWSTGRLAGPHDGVQLTVVEDGLPYRSFVWWAMDLAHRCDEVMLDDVPTTVHAIRTGRDSLKLFHRTRPDAQIVLDQVASESRLPIRIETRVNANSGHMGENSHAMARLAVIGYGPSGQTAVLCGDPVMAATLDTGKVRAAVKNILDRQRVLHGIFEPHPGSHTTPWKVDVVIARLLRDDPDGDATIERCLSAGKARLSPTALLRMSGMQLLSEISLTPDVLWRGDELRITGATLPDGVRLALPGRDIRDVVDSPLLKDAGTIASVRQDAIRGVPRLRIRMRQRMVTLGDDPDAPTEKE
jgi:hypothetical protein